MRNPVSSQQIRSFTLPFFREPINLVLVVLLPIIGIELYGQALGSLPSSLFSGLSGDPTQIGRISGAVFAAAALTGVLGLFQVISARKTDIRLLLCGTSRVGLLVNRLLTVVLISVVSGVATVAVLWYWIDIEAVALSVGVFVLVSLLYSLVGILIGSLIPRELEGSLALVFVADIDTFLSSDFLEIDLVIGKLFPLFYPNKLAKSAVLTGTVETEHVLYTLLYLGAALVAATIAYLHASGTEGAAA